MTSLSLAKGFFASAFAESFSILNLPCSTVLVLGFLALVNTGCATTIAARHPQLDRRAVCVLPSQIESDATEFVFTENNVPVSNLHPEVVDRVAANARTVFEYDPDADPASPRYLPTPYNELECPPRFSMLPSKNEEMLPVAAVNVLLHERRPEPVSKALGDELAKCSNQISGPVNPIEHTMQVNVYVTNKGQTVAAYVADSTLGNRKFNACVANVLRATLWSPITTSAPNVAAAPIALKGLLAEPARAQPPEPVPESGIRRIQPQPWAPPANAPTGRIPRIFVIPISPLVAAAVVFGIIYFWSDDDVPAWASELNPITRQPYADRLEYDEVQRLSPEEIQQLRAAHIKATESQPPPVPVPPPVPPPAPTLTPEQQREQEKIRERCAKIAKKIEHIINAERPPTPPGGKPQGRKGIKWRWLEIAENLGKWGPKPDGSPSKQMQGHLKAYDDGQKEIIKELVNWQVAGCDDMEHGLPHNARQYAAQTPEYGPGKPLEPAPAPKYYPPVIAPAIVPQPKKASK